MDYGPNLAKQYPQLVTILLKMPKKTAFEADINCTFNKVAFLIQKF